MRNGKIDDEITILDETNSVSNSSTIDFTREAASKNKNKWEMFLEGYKNYYHIDFSWPKYIKDCKLYYGEFNIHDFIRAYGKECEEDFKRFRQRVLQKKGINRSLNDATPLSNSSPNKQPFIDDDLIELMTNGDVLRTRLLIRFLCPQTKLEKKNMKRSWRNAKRSGLNQSEWMKSYVGLPFRSGKNDPLDEKYTREEVLHILKKAQMRLDNNSKNLEKSSLDFKKASNDFRTDEQPRRKNYASSDELVENDHSTTSFKPTRSNTQSLEDKLPNQHDNSSSNLSYSKLYDFESSKTINLPSATSEKINNNSLKIESENLLSQDFDFHRTKQSTISRKYNDALNFEKHVDKEVSAIKQDRELIHSELKKVNELKLAEEKRYQELRKKRQALTENLKQNDIFSSFDDDDF